MPNIVNVSLVGYLKEKFDGVSSILLLNYQGMGVKKESRLRTLLAEVGAEAEVVKNSVAKIAFQGTPLEGAAPYLKGPVAIIFGGEDIVGVAKAVQTYMEEFDGEETNGSFVGAVLDGVAIDGKTAEGVHKMPSKRDVQASIVGLALGPGSKLASALVGPSSKVAGIIKAVIEKREQEGAA